MLLGLHYQKIQENVGYCPLLVICGTNKLGNIRSAEGALFLIGNQENFFSTVRERFLPKLCNRSTFPPVLDDLKSPKTIEEIAIQFYNRGRDGTCNLEFTPSTLPIITANWETLDRLDKDPR